MGHKSNIVLIGMPGCGKTTVGEIVAQRLGLKFVDVDAMIEECHGAIPELFARSEDYFRQCETDCAKKAARIQGAVIATGGGIILREENMQALGGTGTIVFLNRSVENIMADIVSETRPLLADGKERLYNLYEQRIALYNKYADIKIDSNQELSKVIDDIMAQIGE